MFITHVTPLSAESGVYVPLPFLCTKHLNDNIFQVGFQQNLTLTLSEVQEREKIGSIVALPKLVPIKDERRVPWLGANNRIWLMYEENPQSDPYPKLIGSFKR